MQRVAASAPHVDTPRARRRSWCTRAGAPWRTDPRQPHRRRGCDRCHHPQLARPVLLEAFDVGPLVAVAVTCARSYRAVSTPRRRPRCSLAWHHFRRTAAGSPTDIGSTATGTASSTTHCTPWSKAESNAKAATCDSAARHSAEAKPGREIKRCLARYAAMEGGEPGRVQDAAIVVGTRHRVPSEGYRESPRHEASRRVDSTA